MVVQSRIFGKNFHNKIFSDYFVDFQEIVCSIQTRNLRCGSLTI